MGINANKQRVVPKDQILLYCQGTRGYCVLEGRHIQPFKDVSLQYVRMLVCEQMLCFSNLSVECEEIILPSDLRVRGNKFRRPTATSIAVDIIRMPRAFTVGVRGS